MLPSQENLRNKKGEGHKGGTEKVDQQILRSIV